MTYSSNTEPLWLEEEEAISFISHLNPKKPVRLAIFTPRGKLFKTKFVSIKVRNPSLSKAFCEEISKLEPINQLHLNGVENPEELINCLSHLDAVSGFEAVNMEFLERITKIDEFPALSRLGFSNCNIGEYELAKIGSMKELDRIDLRGNCIKSEHLDCLGNIKKCNSIILSNNNIEFFPTNFLSDISHVENLSLSSNNIGDLGACQISRVHIYNRLDLRWNNISDIGLRAILQHSKRSDVSILLRGNKIAENVVSKETINTDSVEEIRNEVIANTKRKKGFVDIKSNSRDVLASDAVLACVEKTGMSGFQCFETDSSLPALGDILSAALRKKAFEQGKATGNVECEVVIVSEHGFGDGPPIRLGQSLSESSEEMVLNGNYSNRVALLLDPKFLPLVPKNYSSIPVYGLSPDQIFQIVDLFIANDAETLGLGEVRLLAGEFASPTPREDEQGRITATANLETDRLFVDESVAGLASRMSELIEDILPALDSDRINVSPLISSQLKRYRTELDVQGLQLSPPVLKQFAEVIRDEFYADADAPWKIGGLGKALSQFLLMHDEIIVHFPMDSARDRVIERSPLRSDLVGERAFLNGLERYARASQQAVANDVASDRYLAVVKYHQDQAEIVGSLVALPEDRPDFAGRRDSRKRVMKRYLFNLGGFLEKSAKVGADTTRIADSESGRTLVSSALDLVDKIFTP